MRKSIQDTIRVLTKEKPCRSPEWHVFRGRVTLSYAMIKAELTGDAFARKYLYDGRTRSGLLEKWLENESAMNEISARNLNKRIPGVADVFKLPIFELLADRPVSAQRIRKLLAPYRAKKKDRASLISWQFPGDAERIADRSYVPVLSEDDTHTLFTCNHLHSLIAILGIVRLADVTGDSELHWRASMDLFRALPAILKIPWFREHAESLIRQLQTIRNRMFFSILMFDVDWAVIWRQVEDPHHEPNRLRRPRDPVTLRFVDIEDPIMYAEIIPGAEVRKREQARQARAAKKKQSDGTNAAALPEGTNVDELEEANVRARIDAWLAKLDSEWPVWESNDEEAWQRTTQALSHRCIEFSRENNLSTANLNHMLRALARIQLLKVGCPAADLDQRLTALYQEFQI